MRRCISHTYVDFDILIVSIYTSIFRVCAIAKVLAIVSFRNTVFEMAIQFVRISENFRRNDWGVTSKGLGNTKLLTNILSKMVNFS